MEMLNIFSVQIFPVQRSKAAGYEYETNLGPISDTPEKFSARSSKTGSLNQARALVDWLLELRVI